MILASLVFRYAVDFSGFESISFSPDLTIIYFVFNIVLAPLKSVITIESQCHKIVPACYGEMNTGKR